MDYELARINVHWIRVPTDGGQCSFHVEGFSQHLLRDANGLKTVIRAIKNILDYGTDTRLQKFCEALNAYRKKFIAEKEAAASEKDQNYKAQIKSQPERRRSRRIQLPSYQ
jgi:hypothetical protein